MAIGRTFQESIQKALRGLETGVNGLDERIDPDLDLTSNEVRDLLRYQLQVPGPERLWYIADAFRAGWSIEEVQKFTAIDPWFLVQIANFYAINLTYAPFSSV